MDAASRIAFGSSGQADVGTSNVRFVGSTNATAIAAAAAASAF